MPNIDQELRHQDWTKRTFDLLDFDGSASEFKAHIETQWYIEDFKRLPVYLQNPDHPLFSEL